jgi:ATP-dependent Clp protease ATP-binding subunit ClpB
MVNELRQRLEDRSVTLEMTPAARDRVAREGFDPVYGARPLRRFIQREVETRIARAIIAGEARDGASIRLDVVDDRLDVAIENPSSSG